MIAGVYGERYFLDGEAQAGPQTYDRHLEYLKRIVPKERLHFLNLKDGWEPLCKILGKDVPDVPFPHLNETAALDRILAEKAWLGLKWWSILVSFLAIGIFVILRLV